MSVSKYHPEYAEKAEELAYLGATDELLAVVFDVTRETIRNWKKRHPDFNDAIARAEVTADAKVAFSLYNQAVGYTYKQTVAKVLKDSDGDERLETIEVETHVPGKTTAAMFWLKNRQPERWRDVQHVDHGDLSKTLSEVMNTSRGLPSATPNTESRKTNYTTH